MTCPLVGNSQRMRLACRHAARSLASILKEANGDEESPPKAALKLHMTRRRRKGSGHEN